MRKQNITPSKLLLMRVAVAVLKVVAFMASRLRLDKFRKKGVK